MKLRKELQLRPKRMRIRIGLSMLLFSAVIIALDPQMALPCFAAALFHECGHLLFAMLLHVPLSEMKLDLLGARIGVSSGLISYRAEFFLCAGGPLFSFLLGAFLSHLHFRGLLPGAGGFCLNLRDSSIFLGALNLLPVRGFDGARMLSAVLSVLFSDRISDLADRFFTGGFLILLWGISVYLLLISGSGLTLFTFSVALFWKVFLG